LKKLWSQKSGNTIDDLSISEDGTMVLVRTRNAIYALDKVSGNVIWKYDIFPQAYVSPAVSKGSKIFVADKKSLSALDPKNGLVIWNQSLSEPDGRIVDVSTDMILVNLVGYYVQAFDTETGSLLWKTGVGRGYVQAYIDDDLVYIPDHGIKAVNAESGKTIWSEGINNISYSNFSDAIIYYQSGNQIVAYDVKNRTRLWSLDLKLAGSVDLITEKGFLIVTDKSNLYVFDKINGQIKWRVTIDFPQNPSIIENQIYVLEGSKRIIRVFDLDTGQGAGSLRTSFPYPLFAVGRKDMISTSNILLFSRGNEVFAFGR
jgi:outer membrane protein assembly factor BamB